MRRREDHALSKHTLNLFDGDYAKLQELYGSRVGAAKIIRTLIRAHLKRIQEDAAQRIPLIDELEMAE